MAKTSTAHTRWEGDLQDGTGETRLTSGAAGPMATSWKARTEGAGDATSPEELIAAAHSACFSMALAGILSKKGHAPTFLETEASATFERGDGGFRIASMDLSVRGEVPGMSADEFAEAAETAKNDCPVSKALSGNVAIGVRSELA